jgi:chromosome partitioning protein
MAKIITLANKKGGCGKTTSAVSLGHGLALKGKSVLIVDLDPQGHVALALGMEQEPGIFTVLVAGRPLREVTRQARENLAIVPGNPRTGTAEAMLVYEKARIDTLQKALSHKANGKPEYIIIDTAPSGVGFLQEAALWAADLVIIPTAVDFLSSAGLADLLDRMHAFKEQGWTGALFGILPTFFDTTNESKANRDDLLAAFGDLVFPPIHRATVLRECAAEGVTIFEKDPKSRAAEEYAALIWRVLDA